MPDWMTRSFHSSEALSYGTVAVRMLFAALLGGGIAVVYRRSHERPNSNGYSFVVTLVLLTALVAMTTLVIDDNIARAFSLVGALSIVRFRTVVADTRDTAYVIFAVTAGMAVGVGNLAVCVVAVPIVMATAIFLGALGKKPERAAPTTGCVLEIRMAAAVDAEILLKEGMKKLFSARRLVAVRSAKQGAALDYFYDVVPLPGVDQGKIVLEFTSLPNVLDVEVKEG